MIGQANLPGREQEGKAVILCQSSKKAYYKKFLEDPLAVSIYSDYTRSSLNSVDIARYPHSPVITTHHYSTLRSLASSHFPDTAYGSILVPSTAAIATLLISSLLL